MYFYDCNTSYGRDIEKSPLQSILVIDDLIREMANAGIRKAVVHSKEQDFSPPELGNNLLANDIKKHSQLNGIWSIIPSYTHELPEPEEVVNIMKDNKIIGWRLCPEQFRFLAVPSFLADWLQTAVSYKIPLFINTADGVTLQDLTKLLQEYPELTIILTFDDVWPNDRLLRPFLATFPNFYLDLSHYTTAGGLQHLVGEYGAKRLLFGSGFPDSYFGANMLMIKHSLITEEQKQAIAAGNLERIIREARI